jgi:hypothetical protein
MADHPYRSAPPRAFWSRAVTRAFDPADVPDEAPFRLTRHDRFMTAGSCFAANVRRFLEAADLHYTVTERPHPQFGGLDPDGFYDSFSARYGNIYTARQMAQLLDRAVGAFAPVEACWVDGGTWIDPYRPGLRHRARSAREFDLLTAQHLACVRRAVEQSTVFVFTLGLTEVWMSAADGAVFPACPGTVAGEFDPAKHLFHNLTVEEVLGDLCRLVDRARAINPALRIILTVSPVPLVATATGRHVLVATAYSKSVLRVAADAAARTLTDVAYFPAYELVTGPQAAGAFQPDRRNVTESAIEGVMAAFFATFLEPGVAASHVVPGSGSDAEQAEARLRDAVATAVAAECEEEMADPVMRAAASRG